MAKPRKPTKADAARQRQLSGLQRGREKPIASPWPKLTAAIATDFIALLAAGFPHLDALAYCFPEQFNALDAKQRESWLAAWLNDRLMLDAQETCVGGKWQALDEDQRIDIAMRMYRAQLAYCLYTHDYNDENAPVGKMREAYGILKEHKAAAGGDRDSPFEKAVRELMNRAAGADNTIGAPPVFAPEPKGTQ